MYRRTQSSCSICKVGSWWHKIELEEENLGGHDLNVGRSVMQERDLCVSKYFQHFAIIFAFTFIE